EVIDIQCFGPNGTYAMMLARLTRTPLVYSNHGETFMDAHDSFRTSALLRRSLASTLARADAVTSCSMYAAKDLEHYGLRSSAEIVANAVDADVEPMPVSGLPARYIAGIGRLVDNKGFTQLLEAFASARTRLDDTALVIAGDGPDGSWLREYAHTLGIADRVTFTGALTRGQVVSVLGGALVHVVPSHVEAFGIVILEGWRAGITVVATPNGGPPEFVRDGVDALLCDPYETERLGDLLVELVNDEPQRSRIGTAGRARLAEFTWSTVTDRYDALFARVVPAAPTPTEVER
ncbi:MAG: glycosyltransferase, partial [Actinobacteria bacterium]|nr:glycosyltransferase [Actinomycetota bacterium]